MEPKKRLAQRQKELQDLIVTPAGRAELQALVSRYQATSGSLPPARASVITHILVHERGKGLIAD